MNVSDGEIFQISWNVRLILQEDTFNEKDRVKKERDSTLDVMQDV